MTPQEVGAGITIWFFGSITLATAWCTLRAIIQWARRWSGRTADLERRMQALTHEQRDADDEQSRQLVNHFTNQERAREVYDQDADQSEPADMGWAMFRFEAWEAKVAREAAQEQARHLASDEWARELERWVNWTPERHWGPEGLR